eukprot:1159839-Pelagomonas_calceolata.AAC.20
MIERKTGEPLCSALTAIYHAQATCTGGECIAACAQHWIGEKWAARKHLPCSSLCLVGIVRAQMSSMKAPAMLCSVDFSLAIS